MGASCVRRLVPHWRVLEDGHDRLGLKPVVEDGRVMVEVDGSVPGAQKTVMAMKALQRMADRLAAGEIAEDECELWKARFTY